MRETTTTVLVGNEFWKHSIGVAVIARIIAAHIQAPNIEVYFTAGILHDIGKIVLDQLFPDEYAHVISLVENEAVYFRKAERTVFGRPHTDIGAYVLDRWSIPPILRDAVKNHHSPMDAVIDPKLVSAVHVADSLAHMLHIGDSGERVVPRIESFAERELSISVADFDGLVPEIDEQIHADDAFMIL
jgi:putative nucleotidyltransferase with HDIG domain